jgi:hypothetical protein
MSRPPHAKIFKDGRTWYYEVHDRDGRIVFEDNTGAWDVLLEPALRRVITVRELEGIGQQLPVFQDLVEAAMLDDRY